MDKNKKIYEIWKELNHLEASWNRHCDPQLNWYGNMTFRHITDLNELQEIVRIQDRQHELKSELRSLVGFWGYLHYLFAEMSFIRKHLP